MNVVTQSQDENTVAITDLLHAPGADNRDFAVSTLGDEGSNDEIHDANQSCSPKPAEVNN